MKPLDPEQYRIIHQRIVAALSDNRGQRLRTEARDKRSSYPEHVADHVLTPYQPRQRQ